MLKGIRLFFKYIVMYLSMLFPRSQRICVFGAWMGERFADNSAVLFLEAQERQDILAVWITRSKKVRDRVRSLGYRAYLANSPAGIWYQLRAGYAVVTTGISDLQHALLGRAVLVDVWHGVPLKKIGYDDRYERDWESRSERMKRAIRRIPLGREYVVATSETFRDIYMSAFKVGRAHVLCMGQPRNDLFYCSFDGTEPGSMIHAAMDPGIMNVIRRAHDEGRRVILYAPTHRKTGACELHVKDILDYRRLEKLCETHNALFLIRKHFYHRHEDESCRDLTYVEDITGAEIDAQLLLRDTDILVTDYSSIYIDYLLLDRPIVFYDYDREEYLADDREMYFDYESVTPGPRAESYDALERELTHILEQQGEDTYVGERKRVRDLMYAPEAQGPCGGRILDMIKELR